MAREKVGALLILLFSMAYGLLSFQIPLSFLAQQEFFTSRTMPYAVAVLGIILSLLILVMPTGSPEGKKTLREETGHMDWIRALVLVAAMVAYGLVMQWLGFILASIAFLMVGFYILGERRFWRMALTAVPLVTFLWFLMSNLLGAYIAPGEIFYQIGIL